MVWFKQFFEISKSSHTYLRCFHLVILIARLFSWTAYSRNDKVQEKSIPTERFLFEYELYSEKIKRVIHLGVSHKVTPLKISLLNATGCISRYIDIHQIVYNAKEPINNLQYHNQEMLWEAQRCYAWKEKVRSSNFPSTNI